MHDPRDHDMRMHDGGRALDGFHANRADDMAVTMRLEQVGLRLERAP